ncbi:MAG TPA: serine/threonine-protein kinase [Vicinamibacterales bacterium]|jgi:tRNA A-37 threonylcarbamoyl transferase component Bud32|nr:serine/threonine-protein kinase [Vicinamibacterales bacterium]
MSEAVLDEAIEQIADGLTVDWTAIDRGTPGRAREWAKSLRVLNDIVKLHRDAAADYDQTTMAPATPEVAPSPTPDTWGKYRLTNKVGEGSYGSVYRAWDSELERDVAIKILHRRVGDTKLRERLLQEGRALAKIQHNNVVRVLGIEAHGDRVGLCMEFVRGKTLADIVRGQGRLSAAEAVLIGEDLCRALSAVHGAGFIHRDVKAKNVMRDDTGRMVLMDFGTGRSAEVQNKSDRAGTPLYMAPEVIEEGQQSARSDVYSLGVLLYYLVTADYPVNARTIDELRAAHARREHRWLSELRPDLPVAFMQVVERAIALDPEERYANASELLSALNGLKIGVSPWFLRLTVPLLAIATVFGGMTLLGAITSTHYNTALQRSDFAAADTVWDWLRWGRLTSVPPLLILIIVVLSVAVLRVIRRVAVVSSRGVARLDSAVRNRGTAIAHRLRLDEVSVLASYALLISLAGVTLAGWYFKPLLLQLLAYIPAADSRDLELLSPQYVTYHNYYRGVFTLVTILSVAVWLPVMRLVRKGQSLHWGMWLGGALATCIALACLHMPYRLLIYRNLFEVVQWNGARCSVIGETSSSYLLFCPDVAPPRNRIADRKDPGVTFVGAQERLFSHFGTTPSSH